MFLNIFYKNKNFLFNSSYYWFNNSNISKVYLTMYSYFFFNKTMLHLNSNFFQNHAYYFSIFFFKKEIFYTKLKYSRVPQFDTASGAVASLLSGFFGFLVCEKYGLELIDSGDFLLIYIYIIFLVFSIVLMFKNFNSILFFNNFLYNWFISFF